MFDLIRMLRANRIQVALATNQQRYRLRYMLHELGYATRFDRVLCSCDLGHAKPAREYFAEALEILRLPPANVLFIDDHQSNVEAGKRVGLHARQYHLDEGASAMARLLEEYDLNVD